MDSDTQERAEYERDLQQIEKTATEALVAAKDRPLTEDEIMLVAWSAGLSNPVFKELRK